jgi:thiosulfate/3-mercaptopyruvate sulfurtransferase
MMDPRRSPMNINRFILVLLFLSLSIPSVIYGRDIDPFVSTDWLEKNLNLPELVVIDARPSSEYQKGHIPNSIATKANAWTVNSGDLLKELPADADLLALIGSLGIKETSKVVVVGKGETDFDRADAVRIGWTLLLGGVKNVSVLDGGYAKWRREKRAASVEPAIPAAGTYQAKINRTMLVSKKYVQSSIGKTVLIDTRVPDVFFGVGTEPWAPKPGHIPGAVDLPTPWIFQDGVIRNIKDLEAMANGAAGKNKSKEVIVYCGVGVYASVWHYVLIELLGYTNVNLYDGSMQEWIMDPACPITIFTWR